MSTALNFKDTIDLPKWRNLAQTQTNILNNIGFGCDFRNNEDRHPIIYYCTGVSSFVGYNTKNNGWLNTSAGIASNPTSYFFMSAQGPRGTIAAGATTSSFTLTTVLSTAVSVNALANRGDGRGFKVRIVGNAGGSSGKTEERYIVANTAGTTPTIYVDTPFSFTPANGDAYEFLSGRVYTLGSANSAGSWKYYDVLTNTSSGNLSTTNLPASWTDSTLVGLDELLVPYDRNPGEGFLGILTATASGATSLTGQASGGDAGVVADQYRNFQIRIVRDTATPTAAGQRRNITTHTTGASPVYTVPAWSVTPSANAIYVIENNGNRLIAWVAGSTQTSTYSISGDAWDANTTFAVRPVASAGGSVSVQSFSIEPDVALNTRHSFIFSFRGNGSNTLDLFDIAGATTGTWTSAITYGSQATQEQFSANSCGTLDPTTMQGRYIYIVLAVSTTAPQRIYRFDMKNRVLEAYTVLNIFGSNIGVTAPKNIAYTSYIDGTTKLSFIILVVPNTSASLSHNMFSLPITR
jgi:hypothetical protein